MAAASIASFTFESFVSQVQTIQNQATQFENVLNHRCQENSHVKNQLKSRSFTFIDPYGHHLIEKFFDHDLIIKVIKHFKKNYVPRYLQK